jgi:hypothetical protein
MRRASMMNASCRAVKEGNLRAMEAAGGMKDVDVARRELWRVRGWPTGIFTR